MERSEALVAILVAVLVAAGSAGCVGQRVGADQCYWAGTLVNLHGDAERRIYERRWRAGASSIEMWRGLASNREDGKFSLFVPLDRESASVLLIYAKRPGDRKTAQDTGDGLAAYLLRWGEMPDWWKNGNLADSAARFPDPMKRLLSLSAAELENLRGAHALSGRVECQFESDIAFFCSFDLRTTANVPLDRQFISFRRDPAVPQLLTKEQREREATLAAKEEQYVAAPAVVQLWFQRRRDSVDLRQNTIADRARQFDEAFAQALAQKSTEQ